MVVDSPGLKQVCSSGNEQTWSQRLGHDVHLHHHRMEAALKVNQPWPCWLRVMFLISTR